MDLTGLTTGVFFAVLATAVAMLPVSLYQIAVSIKRRESTRGPAGWLAFSLVTLGLVGLILYPLLMSARNKARNITCYDNIRMLSKATMQYAQDSDGYLPPANRWGDAVKPYVEEPDNGGNARPLEDAWHCAVATTPYSYAFNSALPHNPAKLS